MVRQLSAEGDDGLAENHLEGQENSIHGSMVDGQHRSCTLETGWKLKITPLKTRRADVAARLVRNTGALDFLRFEQWPHVLVTMRAYDVNVIIETTLMGGETATRDMHNAWVSLAADLACHCHQCCPNRNPTQTGQGRSEELPISPCDEAETVHQEKKKARVACPESWYGPYSWARDAVAQR